MRGRRAIYTANRDSNTWLASADNPRVYARSSAPRGLAPSAFLPRSLSRGTRKRGRLVTPASYARPRRRRLFQLANNEDGRRDSPRGEKVYYTFGVRLILLASRLSADRRPLLFTLSSPSFFSFFISLPLAPRPS